MVVFQLRRGNAAQWLAANPKLRAGEHGVELDSGRFKIGNGISTWTELPYFVNENGVAVLLAQAIEELNTTGIAGDSAYEVAVKDGFEGTVTEWLISLTGPKGDTGDQGIQGERGPKGDTGDQGIQGIQGERGEQGLKGDTGDQGIQGVKGDPGNDGASVTVTAVPTSEWPPDDTNPLHIYYEVAD